MGYFVRVLVILCKKNERIPRIFTAGDLFLKAGCFLSDYDRSDDLCACIIDQVDLICDVFAE